jgi:uncharacterized membrane protein
MRDRRQRALIPLALLASATGARTWTGLAALSSRAPTKLAAVGELIYDKVPSVPRRVDAGSLIGRVAAGAVLGAIVAGRTGHNRAGSAIVGGVIAFASAQVTYRMRRALSGRMPAMAAAFVEDGIVLCTAATGAALLRARPARRGVVEVAAKWKEGGDAHPPRSSSGPKSTGRTSA